MADSLPPQLIGLDWGTTSLRAYLIADGGVVVDIACTAVLGAICFAFVVGKVERIRE